MKNYIVKIKTPLWEIGLLLMCFVLSLFALSFPGEDSGRMVRSSPVFLIVLVLVVLIIEWKTVYIGLNEMWICSQLVFLKRKITLDRICSLDLIIKEGEYILLFALDDCPSLRNDKASAMKYKRYVSRHPIKVISMRCNKEEAMLCKQNFDSLTISTDVILPNAGGRLGDS